MAKYVKTDYVPEDSRGYLTAGKEYRIISGDEDGGYFVDDEGFENFAYYPHSIHLDGRPWTVISR